MTICSRGSSSQSRAEFQFRPGLAACGHRGTPSSRGVPCSTARRTRSKPSWPWEAKSRSKAVCDSWGAGSSKRSAELAFISSASGSGGQRIFAEIRMNRRIIIYHKNSSPQAAHDVSRSSGSIRSPPAGAPNRARVRQCAGGGVPPSVCTDAPSKERGGHCHVRNIGERASWLEGNEGRGAWTVESGHSGNPFKSNPEWSIAKRRTGVGYVRKM